MPDDKWWLATPARPVVPFVDVDVRAAHSGPAHLDKNFVIEDRRNRDVHELEPGTGVMFYEGLHLVGGQTGSRAKRAGAKATKRKAAEKCLVVRPVCPFARLPVCPIALDQSRNHPTVNLNRRSRHEARATAGKKRDHRSEFWWITSTSGRDSARA